MCIRDRGIKGDDIVNAHIAQFLKRQCTVERFSGGTLMLAALIEERHNDSDSSGLSSAGCDDTLQILIMIVRRHVIHISAK